MFAALLCESDARLATEVVDALLAHGLQCALAGGLAIQAQLRAHGRPVSRRQQLNDIDLVVEGFASIPETLAGAFLQHHVHPDAGEGKMLLQLIDRRHAIRIDFFDAFGRTLSRACNLDDETGALRVTSIEDLTARATALVCGSLQRRRTLDPKHVLSFTRLRGLGAPHLLADAWENHRQSVTGTLEEADAEAARLLERHPELIVADEYSSATPPCARCRQQGRFRPAPRDTIVEILGYC
jgi:hypothetical protein